MNETFSVPPGGSIDSYQPHGFHDIFSIWVDNFSGGWLKVNNGGLWVPPYTRGWKATIFPSTASITVRSYAFANGIEITGATGQAAQVTIWDEPQGDSEGIDFFDAQTVPLFGEATNTAGFGAVVVIPAPAAGRIRVYDITFNYLVDSIDIYEDVGVNILLGGPVVHTTTTLSPASPTQRIILTSPGSDFPIGESMRITVFNIDTTKAGVNQVKASVRYAII